MKSSRPMENAPSTLLSFEENEIVFKLLGSRCSTSATAIVQLYTTEAPNHNKWIKRHTGVLCFVKDGSKRSYYFRIYCLIKKTIIWEHEIYNEIKYLPVRSFFHTFEGQDGMVGFSFANEEEAGCVISAVQSKLESRQRRREERRARLSANKLPAGDSVELREKRASPEVPNGFNYKPQVMQLSESSLRNKNKNLRGKFRKEDIGQPENFRHVFHVGPDAQEKVDETLKEFFQKAGIEDTHLRDEKTRTFIYDFISHNGGMDAVKQEVQTKPTQQKTNQQPLLRPPPIPSRATPVNRRTPPPPPSRVFTPQGAPPSRPPAVKPPPSSATSIPTPPSLPVTKPPAAATSPPPPPPPPIDGLLNHKTLKTPDSIENNNSSSTSTATSQNSNKNSAPAAPDLRAALMDSIRNAPTLRKVQVEPKTAAASGDTRSNLLNEIRGGVELRSVSTNAVQKPDEGPKDGLAGALARALMARQIAINPDTDSSDSESLTDEDDWNA